MKNGKCLKTFFAVLLLLAAIVSACRSSDTPIHQEDIPEYAIRNEDCLETDGRKKKPHPAGTDIDETENETADVSSSMKQPFHNDDTGYASSSPSDPLQSKGHWEYREVLVSQPWEEMVLVKDGYMENVLVSEAWEEEITYCAIFGSTMVEMEVCNTCGAQFQGGINEHLSQTGHSGWHNEYVAIDEPHCQSYDSYVVYHDAVYQEVWHDPEYETVYHEAIYKTEKYWVDD